MSAVPALPPPQALAQSCRARAFACPAAHARGCGDGAPSASWWRAAWTSPRSPPRTSPGRGSPPRSLLNLASVAGKAIVWKVALDALPEERPVRYGHVVPALFIGFLLNTVLFARVGELARIAVLTRRQRLAGESIPASTIGGTAVAEQLVLGVALALTVVALAPVLHVPHMIWQLVIAFVLVLAALAGTLLIVHAQRARPARRPARRRREGPGAVLAGRARRPSPWSRA